MELISVIVPAYNVEPYLRRCVNTIVGQTYRNLEIILVDDGSTDGTGILCDEIAREDSRILVIHKENGGLSDARNAGLAVASGDFISFIDADDYIELDMYEHMIMEIKDSGISMVTVGFIITDIDGDDKVLVPEQKLFLTKEEAFMNLFEDGKMFPSSVNKLFRRCLFDELRYVKGIINEDTEIIFKIVNLCNRIIVTDRAAYHYVLRNGSITQSNFTMKDYQSLIAYESARKVCKVSCPSVLPYASYYELRGLYEAQAKLANSETRVLLKKQAFLLRWKIAVAIVRCLKWREIRNKYGREILIYTSSVLLGYRITYRLMMLKQRMVKS